MSINSHPLVSTNLTHDISPIGSSDPETQPMMSMSTSTGSPFSPQIYNPLIMSKWNVLAYAMGHVLNDMSAACWFSYLLILLQKVQGLSSYQSGIVLLCGQLCDAIATPLVGIFSDASQGCPMLRLGRRQLYYVGGVMVVMVNYFLVFGWCMPCTAYRMEPIVPTASNGTSSTDTTFYSSHDASILVVYYAIAASLFNVGWASVQVSHMSLVPELTLDEHKRVELNSARYAFTVGSNVLVFSVLFLFIHVLHYDKQQQFRYLAYVSLVVGITCSFFFLIGTHEQPARQHHNSQTAAGAGSWKWYYWFRVKQFYRVGCVYMCTRLVVNVSQVFLPFYVTDVVTLSEVFITIIPCVVYVSSFVSAALMKIVNQKIGRINTFVLGTLLCGSALIGLFFITESSWYLIFPMCIVLGLGNATIMICSVQLEADLVDTNHASGAFVYGALSFTDKLSNGIAIFFLQYYNDDTSTYIRHCVCIVPLVACGVALAMAANIHWSLIQSGRNNEIVDQYCILEEQEREDEEDQSTQFSVTHVPPASNNPWRRRSSAVTVVGQSE